MSESILKRALSAITGLSKRNPEPEEKKGHFSEEVKAVILETFEKQDALMKRFDDGEIDSEEADRELRRLERERLRRQIDAELRSSMVTVVSKAVEEYPASSAPESAPREKLRRFKFDGRLAWAWEVENSVPDAAALNELLEQNKGAAEEGQKLAEHLFHMKAIKAERQDFKEHIDEDGADILLPNLPYSPYTDEGAAFMVSMVYAWRGMAEEWNVQEEQRYKELRDKQAKEKADELSKYLASSVDAMIKHELERKSDDALDAKTFNLSTSGIKATDFAKLFGTPVVSEERTGLSKIAAGIAAGDLKKSKF